MHVSLPLYLFLSLFFILQLSFQKRAVATDKLLETIVKLKNWRSEERLLAEINQKPSHKFKRDLK
jgi:hypothetical protein